MLGDDQYRHAAKRIKHIYDGTDGPGRTADAIIKFAGR
jgi:hypothetical protein